MIYFAETKIDQKRYVKIGYSLDPTERVKELQTGCPVPIKLLFAKTGNESYFHTLFANYNVLNEWFLVEGELEKFIDRHLLVYK
jgi:hypothetical protein